VREPPADQGQARREAIPPVNIREEALTPPSTLTHCFPRSFTFYVAHPIHFIVEDPPSRPRPSREWNRSGASDIDAQTREGERVGMNESNRS
jgi:hypothetical protein